MSKIVIDASKCDGESCLDCTEICPEVILKFVDGKVVVSDPDECTLCETCVDLCPNGCISVED